MKKNILSIIPILLLSTLSFAQTNNYNKQWKRVENYELQDLPKSALSEVEHIYSKAKKQNNNSQIIKSFIYKAKFALILEEDAQLSIINDLYNEIDQSTMPTKNILESILADLYWQYFQQNRYKFYQRTHTENTDQSDFRTWDLQTIFKEAHLHYQNSLINKIGLQKIDLKDYAEILINQDNSKTYRPTLYDFLAHRAIDFYKIDERNLTIPNYQFEIDNENLLKNNDTFLNTNLQSKDSLSQQLHALYLYKDLTKLHLKNTDPTALVDLTLERMKFVKQNAIFKNKDSIYLSSLLQLQNEFKAYPVSTEIAYKIAEIYNQKANGYNPKNNLNQFKRIEALKICEKATQDFPNSNGTKKCNNLILKIQKKNLRITSERFVSINQNSRLLINYKNLSKLNFEIYPINEIQELDFNKSIKDSAKIALLKSLHLIKKWQSQLKNENDYQNHTTEVLLPALNHGKYLIIAFEKDSPKLEEIFAYNFIQISNIALIENNDSGENSFQIVNRNTGKPLKNARVNIKNYNQGRYNKPFNQTFYTDKNGQIEFKTYQHYNNVIITVNHKEDKAIFGDFYFYKNNKQSNINDEIEINVKPFLFTDRSIYRPGQIIFFKGILIQTKEENSKIVVGEEVIISLYDVNQQLVKKLTLETNEFGSFNGEFVLPNSGLTGDFYIQVEEGDKNSKFYDNINDFKYSETFISVEEYKRPKFETEFKPITKSFKLNDSVTVEGKATAFSGSNISEAKVSYRVVRKAEFPYRNYWYDYPPVYGSNTMEIIHGETVTDADGNYKLTFKAIPDLKINKDELPVFNYLVYADVTDINGETHSAKTTIKVGYHTINATIEILNKVDKTKTDNTITIHTKNLNGEFIPTKGTLKIYKLQAPKNVLRKRAWEAPDYSGFSKEEFKKLFPHDAFQDEYKEQNWEKSNLVYESVFDTSHNEKIILNEIFSWKSGKYIAQINCKDQFGQTVENENIFTLFSPKDTKVFDNQLFYINTDKSEYKVGGKAIISLASASNNISIIVNVEKDHKIIDTKIIHLSNNAKKITIPINKDDIGGFTLKYHLVNYNSFKSGMLPISVPYPIEDLEIITKTFKDKIQPGSNQNWSFTIKGSKGEKVAAEILASMYDASLDQFKYHQWNFNPINKNNYYNYDRNATANKSFGSSNFNIRNIAYYRTNTLKQAYNQLNWFGFSFNKENLYRMQMVENSNTLDEVVATAAAISPAKRKGQSFDHENSSNIPPPPSPEEIEKSLKSIKARTNFNETAFFYPNLTTDKEGNINFNFTIPEALTQWKLQLLAHDKELKTGYKQLNTITQKELMVIPNVPRFFRQNDKITINTKITNLSDKNLNGTAQIVLTDVITQKDITQEILKGTTDKIKFSVNTNGNTNVNWTLLIPENAQAIQYKIVALAGNFSDGEQNILPVLSNRMLVTETLSMQVKGNQAKTFTLDKLKNNSSTTLKNHKLTLDVVSNPVWYAVQAIPYLMEYPYECSEQTFSRYYANSLATFLVNSNPKIEQVFKQWSSSEDLISNLEKNSELKSIIIQETPWLRDAQNETEQKKRLALLFDINKSKNEQEKTFQKLKQMQMANGGFPWFKGNQYPNRNITQHIAIGFGHLNKLTDNIFYKISKEQKKVQSDIVHFLDDEIIEDYKNLLKAARKYSYDKKTDSYDLKKEKEFLNKNHTHSFQLQYLYMRSFYQDLALNNQVMTAFNYYKKNSYTFWTDFKLYDKGLITLIANRNNNQNLAKNILNSLDENSITDEELGMYWKENKPSWYWFQSPIETQTLMIEVFSEIGSNQEKLDNLKLWLLKNKQTNHWKTTKATTNAIYAILSTGSNWLAENEMVKVKVGEKTIDPFQLEGSKVETGTGYFKTSWNTTDIKPEMATITLEKKSKGVVFGGLYWQYFEDLDKITTAESSLQINKKLYLKSNSDHGKKLIEITNNTKLKLGDLVTVRIEIKVDREMEFIHLKDMRASGFEPVNTLSQYKYQDGLGYYESTKDASTNFFFDVLQKGVYIFEYDLRVNNQGDFSNGITTIQSMYAPEFSSHSKGIRVIIK